MKHVFAILSLFLSIFMKGEVTDSLSTPPDTVLHPWTANHTFNATSNGISIVPAFSLGRPALIYTSSYGNGTFRLEPEIRMSYDGEPWSTLLWGRYILPKTRGWQFTTAAHYALLFSPEEDLINGTLTRSYRANRYLGFQATASHELGKSFKINAFSLLARGWFKGASPHLVQLHALSLSTPDLPAGQLKLNVRPQLYVLNFAGPIGLFYSANYSLKMAKSKWSIDGMISQPLVKEADLTVANVVWNVGLSYNISHTHQRLEIPRY